MPRRVDVDHMRVCASRGRTEAVSRYCICSTQVRALEGGSSTTKQILIDQDLRGWKEVEYEVCVGVLWPSYAIDATRLRQTRSRVRIWADSDHTVASMREQSSWVAAIAWGFYAIDETR